MPPPLFHNSLAGFTDALAGTTVLITGGTGFIGRHAVLLGDRIGARVHLLSRRPPPSARPGRILADIADRERVRDAILGLRPQAILHLAASGVCAGPSPDQVLRVNIGGTAAVLEAASALSPPPHLVCAGSGFEYLPRDRPLTEDDPVGPTSVYGVSKAAGSMLCRALGAGIPVTILRLFSVYGPGEREPRLMPHIIENALRGREIPTTPGDQRRDYTHVTDAAEAFWRALLHPPLPGTPRVINVGTGLEVRLKDFMAAVVKALERRGIPALLRPGARPFRQDEIMTYLPDVGRLRSVFGWVPPTGLEQGIEQTLDAWFEHP